MKDGARGIEKSNPSIKLSLTEKSKNESYRFQRLYRNLYNQSSIGLHIKTYMQNTGSMTAGADGITIDGMVTKESKGLLNPCEIKLPAKTCT